MEKLDLKGDNGRALLRKFAVKMADAQSNGASYDLWATAVGGAFILSTSQWVYLLDLWQLTEKASRQIYIESLTIRNHERTTLED